MTARPMLFSGPMVRALLEDRKTQTRRIVKPSVKGCTVGAYTGGKGGTQPVNVQEDGDPWTDIICPYGRPGDLIYVRETWAEVGTMDPGYLVYRATYPHDLPPGLENVPDTIEAAGYRWKSSMLMPRKMSRITLRIRSIRVERLHEVTETDAIAEGIDPLFTAAEAKSRPELNIEPMPWLNYLWHGNRSVFGLSFAQIDAWEHQSSSYKTATGSYSSLWESINGIGSWAENPWVWVVEFEVIRNNVDQVLKDAA